MGRNAIRTPRLRVRGRLLLTAVLPGLGVALAVGAFGSGCATETRYAVLSTIFDGVPKPGEVRPPRRTRRVARVEPPRPPPAIPIPAPEPVKPEPVAPLPGTWEDLVATFPKDMVGNVDWVAAFKAGLIRPRPGIAPETPDIPPMPLDVVLDPGIPAFQVVFPHEAHTMWLRCDNCHPAIFAMKAGADPITMAAIFQGEYCGRCHGKVSFRPETSCVRCHRKLGG